MLHNYVIVAGFLLKIKLVPFFLCCNRGARKSLNLGKPLLGHCGQLPGPGWVKDPL